MEDLLFSDAHHVEPAGSVTQVMRELSNETHWEVLACIASCPKTVGAIAEELPIERTTVSKSLIRLQHYGLVQYVRRKNNHVYSMNAQAVTIIDGSAFQVTIEAAEGGRMSVTVPSRRLRLVRAAAAPARTLSRPPSECKRPSWQTTGKVADAVGSVTDRV